MTTPSRLPTWAAMAALSPSLRAEPPGSTASVGYAIGAVPPASDWNWMDWQAGLWLRHLHEGSILGSDVFASPGGAVPSLLTGTGLTFTIGGPLTQSPATGGVYYWNGVRLWIDLSVTTYSMTFAAASTNYVHARVQQSETSRAPEPEILVSTNPTEVGYAAILRVETGGATVTSQLSLADGGPIVAAPWTFAERIHIDQTTGATSALRVDYALSGAAGVAIAPKVGATQNAVDVTSPSGARAVFAHGTSSDPIVGIEQAGAGQALYALHTGGGGVGLEAEISGVGGSAVIATANGSSAAFRAQTATGGAPLVLEPVALGPASPEDGQIWFEGPGSGPFSMRFNTSTASRYFHCSQSGQIPFGSLSTTTTTLAAGSAATTLASVNYSFVLNGVYRIRFACLHGRTAGSTSIAQYECRVNGVALGGASLRAVDIPSGGSFVGTQFVGMFVYEATYTALATALYLVDLRVTTSAGTSSTVYTNKEVTVIPMYS